MQALTRDELVSRAITRALEHLESARRGIGYGRPEHVQLDLMLAAKAVAEAQMQAGGGGV